MAPNANAVVSFIFGTGEQKKIFFCSPVPKQCLALHTFARFLWSFYLSEISPAVAVKIDV